MVVSHGKESRVGYPTRKRYSMPVCTRHVVQDRTFLLESPFFILAPPPPPSFPFVLPPPRPPCPRGQNLIPCVVRRAGYCWAVVSPGKEPRMGHPTRQRYPVPVRTRHVVQDRILPHGVSVLPARPPSIRLPLPPAPSLSLSARAVFDSLYCLPCWILLGGSFFWKRTCKPKPM